MTDITGKLFITMSRHYDTRLGKKNKAIPTSPVNIYRADTGKMLTTLKFPYENVRDENSALVIMNMGKMVHFSFDDSRSKIFVKVYSIDFCLQ